MEVSENILDQWFPTWSTGTTRWPTFLLKPNLQHIGMKENVDWLGVPEDHVGNH